MKTDFVLRQLAERMIEKDEKMYAVFVHLEKAYEKVCRKELWEVLQRYGLSGELLRSIRAMYQSYVRIDSEVTDRVV